MEVRRSFLDLLKEERDALTEYKIWSESMAEMQVKTKKDPSYRTLLEHDAELVKDAEIKINSVRAELADYIRMLMEGYGGK